jgi:hypothetical protein
MGHTNIKETLFVIVSHRKIIKSLHASCAPDIPAKEKIKAFNDSTRGIEALTDT